MGRKKGTVRQQEDLLKQKIRNNIFLAILIPGAFLIVFLFFSSKLGFLFSLVSINRNDMGPTDQIAPPAPIFKELPNAVKDKKIKAEGFAEAGTTIKLFVNGPEQQTSVAANDGTFVFEDVTLINGRNTIFAKAIDGNGNESEKSQTIAIVVDNEAPKLEIESPKDKETIKNLNKRITIKGKLNEKATVTINEKFVILHPDLTFEFILGVDEGWTEIKVVATDDAKNSTIEEFQVKYEKTSN